MGESMGSFKKERTNTYSADVESFIEEEAKPKQTIIERSAWQSDEDESK